MQSQDDTIDRLAKEARDSRKRILKLQELCEAVNPELINGTPEGAVQSLVKRILQLEMVLRQQGLEVPNW